MSTIVDQQGADGHAHLTYFNVRRQMSFTWDGQHGDFINVAVGGYGEAPFAMFPLGFDPNRTSAQTVFYDFSKSCERFIADFESYDESYDEPQP